MGGALPVPVLNVVFPSFAASSVDFVTLSLAAFAFPGGEDVAVVGAPLSHVLLELFGVGVAPAVDLGFVAVLTFCSGLALLEVVVVQGLLLLAFGTRLHSDRT